MKKYLFLFIAILVSNNSKANEPKSLKKLLSARNILSTKESEDTAKTGGGGTIGPKIDK